MKREMHNSISSEPVSLRDQLMVNGYRSRLSPAQAAEFSGLSLQKLKHLRRVCAIRYFRTGYRSIIYDRDSLAAWLASRAIEPIQGA